MGRLVNRKALGVSGGELNRSTCRLGADSVDPRSHVLYGGQGWTSLFAAATSDKSLTQHFVQIL